MELELMKDIILGKLNYYEPISYGDLWKSCGSPIDDVFDEAIVTLMEANVIKKVGIDNPYKAFLEAGYIINNASDIKV